MRKREGERELIKDKNRSMSITKGMMDQLMNMMEKVAGDET